jgi:hypothetical protein
VALSLLYLNALKQGNATQHSIRWTAGARRRFRVLFTPAPPPVTQTVSQAKTSTKSAIMAAKICRIGEMKWLATDETENQNPN